MLLTNKDKEDLKKGILFAVIFFIGALLLIMGFFIFAGFLAISFMVAIKVVVWVSHLLGRFPY